MRARARIAGVLLLMGAPSCSPTATDESFFGTTSRRGRPPTTLVVNNFDEPEYLDPGLSGDQVSTILLNDLFEGLVLKHPRTLEPTQGVAQRYDKSADNRLYRFHLRPDARWSDGKPVTAKDFVYAWTRVLTPKTASRNAALLHVLKNGKAYQQNRIARLTAKASLHTATNGPAVSWLARGTHVRVHQRKSDWSEVSVFHGRPTFKETEAKPTGAASPRAFVRTQALGPAPELLGVRALGDRVLEVELEQPIPYFLELCTFVTTFPVRRDLIERFSQAGDPDRWYRAENMINNGPYRITDWQFRYRMVFERNPHHPDHDLLKTHRIVWLAVPANQATLDLYRTGEVDYVGAAMSLPAAQLDGLSRYADFHRSDKLATYWYEFNVNKKPVDDARVRWALNFAIDKAQLVDKVTRGGQKPATHFVPDAMGAGYARASERDRAKGRDPFAEKQWGFSPERARRLLTQAGYPVRKTGNGYKAEGFPDLEILYNTSEGHRKLAVTIQDMFKRHLGITVALRNEEWKVMLKNMRDGHFQLARLGWTADYNHPRTFLDLFRSYSSNNHTGWRSDGFDQLMSSAQATGDHEKSIELYRKAELVALEGMARLPLYFYTKSTLIKPYVRGLYPNPLNHHPMRWAHVDPHWKAGQKPRFGEPAYPPRPFPPPGRFSP